MICLHSIPSGEEWVLVLHGSQYPHENSRDLREFPDNSFLVTMLWYGLAFIVNQKWKSKIFKLWKVDDRIQILEPARSRNKRNRDMN